MATRDVAPQANNEGGIGTVAKKWANIWATLVNGLTVAAQAVGFTIAGGTTSKTLTVDETVTMSAKANLASPTFTGTPAAPTAADNTATTQLATTAFAKSQDAVLARPAEQMIWITSGATETLKVAHSAIFDVTTNSFPVGGKFLIADWKVATTLLQKLTGGAGFQLEVLVTSGYLKLTLNALTFTTATAPALINGASHTIIARVSVGTTQTTVYWYIDGVLFETSAAQNNTTSLANGNPLYILGTSTARHAGGVGFVIVGNRDFTSDEMRSLYRNGIAFADKWGSQTALYTSDFSAGVDGWVNATGAPTVDGNIDSIGGQNDVLRITVGSTSQAYAIQKGITAGSIKNNKFSLLYYIPSTNSNVNGLIVKDAAGAYVTIGGQQSTLDAWTTVGSEFVSGSNAVITLRIFATQDGSTTITDSGGNDVIYIKTVLVHSIGATLALEPEGIQNSAWYGSANGLNAAYPSTGWSLTRNINVPRTNTEQPAFFAYTPSAVPNVTGDGTTYSLAAAIWTEIYDYGSCFSNGVFTAPISWVYHFDIAVRLAEIASNHTGGILILITTDKTLSYFINPYAAWNAANSALTLPISTDIWLDAGDTARIGMYVYGGSKVVDIAPDTIFSGHLL